MSNSVKRPHARPPVREDDRDEKVTVRKLLGNIQEKLNSPVFNGGFDTLLLKVESIEVTQQKTLDQLSDLNKIIYEPDEGLFSRIKSVEKTFQEENIQLKNAFSQQTQWKEAMIKQGEREIVEKEELNEKIHQLSIDIMMMKSWKNIFTKICWIIFPMIVAGFGKIVYDFVVTHISFR